MKILLKFGENQILKTNHGPTSGHRFFSILQIFLKMEAVLQYSKNIFFNILYTVSANKFSANRNSIFLVRAILLLLEINSVIKR